MARKKLTSAERKARMKAMTTPKKSDTEDKDKIKKEKFENTKKNAREQDIECPP